VSGRVPELRAEMEALCRAVGRRVQFMEVCGTHTVAVFRSGIRSLLPANLRLVSGPGCPVCVTAQRDIDAAIELAAGKEVILVTYGDMMRVPGRLGSLERLRADGAEVRVISSALSGLQIAGENPDREVVFFAVGFETTAPATAAAVLRAERDGLENFSVLMCHKLVVPAMRALLSAGEVPLDGFLCPGHVSVIIGAEAYRPVVEQYGKPCVVAGFEPEQILSGLVHLLRQVRSGEPAVENVYSAAVSESGNRAAVELLERVFVPADAPWRALGVIPRSGLELRPEYRRFDALQRFGITIGQDQEHPGCICGEVIQGRAEPADCPLFGEACTPLDPVGPCMVSSEGTCSAWYKYHRGGRTGAAAASSGEVSA